MRNAQPDVTTLDRMHGAIGVPHYLHTKDLFFFPRYRGLVDALVGPSPGEEDKYRVILCLARGTPGIEPIPAILREERSVPLESTECLQVSGLLDLTWEQLVSDLRIDPRRNVPHLHRLIADAQERFYADADDGCCMVSD